MKTFENNGKNISENIAELKLERKFKSLLYFPLGYICVEETDFENVMISLPNKTKNPLFRFKGHN